MVQYCILGFRGNIRELLLIQGQPDLYRGIQASLFNSGTLSLESPKTKTGELPCVLSHTCVFPYSLGYRVNNTKNKQTNKQNTPET